MPATRVLTALAGCLLTLSAALFLVPPRALPDRLAVIAEDAVRIDNDFYSTHDWWHVDQPLRLFNAARIPWFVQQWSHKLSGPSGDERSPTFLDVGSGGGIATEALARSFASARFVGVDLSEGSIVAAQRHAKVSGLDIEYIVGPAYDLPFSSATFDGAVCSDVLEHLHDVPRALSEIARVLKPGGVFVFDTINRTRFSWLLVVRIAQDLLHIVPHAAHDWRLFITPAELDLALRQANLVPCDLAEIVGMRPTVQLRPLFDAILGKYWTGGTRERGLLASLLGPWTLTAHQGGSYLGHATKAPVEEPH
ncbi:S-adenosyl-L-methionine-dependent methyltransferase [Acaromyces ingoldii]|uniref:S-adenosyl-L-methionine-dependent methyltransferase n=1 Tax=Acaromyces ingoldii TaxID=215250 RepID=A0A316YL87_9BASI|nr:S-adenosyl-L-methionine-dependent methyltransferase [Acaromyces ingoldii]PWN89418.1 S-adenosyl-L-methionine-dependent methyltransferase [Acaromyces ingoldii]